MDVLCLKTFKEIAQQYSFFVIDIWGVLHDGNSLAFPDAIDSLKWLRNNNKKTILLSNSPRNADDVKESLRQKAITDDLYDILLTSGQEVQNLLSEKDDEFFKKLGKKVFVIGYSNLYTNSGGIEVEDLEKADYILVTRVPENNLEISKPLLKKALEKNLPLVCANPDRQATTFEGIYLCPGIIYDYYIEQGGTAIAIGKPENQIYQRMWSLAKKKFSGFTKPETLIIGDGLYTDILGANRQGIDSLLITKGLHSKSFSNIRLKESVSQKIFFEITKQNFITPNFLCEKLN